MADTPRVSVRVDPELTDAARAVLGKPGLDVAVVIRAALLALTGLAVRDALKKAQTRPGPKPKTETVNPAQARSAKPKAREEAAA